MGKARRIRSFATSACTPGWRCAWPTARPITSKYNPVERCWGVLEHHWNGSLLDSVETVEQFGASMTWKGLRPVVQRVALSIKPASS